VAEETGQEGDEEADEEPCPEGKVKREPFFLKIKIPRQMPQPGKAGTEIESRPEAKQERTQEHQIPSEIHHEEMTPSRELRTGLDPGLRIAGMTNSQDRRPGILLAGTQKVEDIAEINSTSPSDSAEEIRRPLGDREP
jgi:hypothetical protein